MYLGNELGITIPVPASYYRGVHVPVELRTRDPSKPYVREWGTGPTVFQAPVIEYETIIKTGKKRKAIPIPQKKIIASVKPKIKAKGKAIEWEKSTRQPFYIRRDIRTGRLMRPQLGDYHLGLEPISTTLAFATQAVPFFKGLFGTKKAKPPRAHAGIVLKQGVPPTVGNVLKAIPNLVTPWQNFQRKIPPPSSGAFMTASGGFKGHERITMGFSPQVQSALSQVTSEFNKYLASLPPSTRKMILETDTGFYPGGHSLDFTQQVAFIPGWVGYELASNGEIGAIVTQAINRLSSVMKNKAATIAPAPPPVAMAPLTQPYQSPVGPTAPAWPFQTYLPTPAPQAPAPRIITMPTPAPVAEPAPAQAGIDPTWLMMGGLGLAAIMMMNR